MVIQNENINAEHAQAQEAKRETEKQENIQQEQKRIIGYSNEKLRRLLKHISPKVGQDDAEFLINLCKLNKSLHTQISLEESQRFTDIQKKDFHRNKSITGLIHNGRLSTGFHDL
jgi:hypothetical protein